MSLKELGKEELSSIMELTGEQFVMMQISTWLQLMFSVDLWINGLELSAGEVLEAYHTPEREIFLMNTKNQFWWTMFHAQEMKIALISAYINLSETVVTTKTSLLLAHLHIITPQKETTDWLTQKIWPTQIILSKVFGEELKISTELNGTKFVTMTLPWTMQKYFADLLTFHWVM